MILSEIWATIDLHTNPVGVDSIPLLSAFGRIPAVSFAAGLDVPPCDVSALDGYVLWGKGPTFLLKGVSEPFMEVPCDIGEGEAFFIPTGGCLPPNGRFVAREQVREKGDLIEVETDEDQRKLVKAGDWLRRGTEIVVQGVPIDPSAMALLSLARIENCKVFRKPAVAIVTTGSELKRGRLVDSNRFLLAGLVQRDGGELVESHIADDTDEDLFSILSGLQGPDLLVFTGGTSKGKRDLTKQAVDRWGGKFYLQSPSVLPGKTMAFAKKDRTTVCVLPGNPRAVRTCYEVFVKRVLFRLAGRTWAAEELDLPLTEGIQRTEDASTLTPALLERGVSGLRELYPREPDAFVVTEGEARSLPLGARVKVIVP